MRWYEYPQLPDMPRRGNGPPAQSNALGDDISDKRPEGAKALNECHAFALSGRGFRARTLHRALPWAMCSLAFQAA